MQVDQEQNEEPMPVGRHHLEHLIKKGKSMIKHNASLPLEIIYIYIKMNLLLNAPSHAGLNMRA